MTAGPPTIFAMGGGGFTMEPDNAALDEFILSLSPRPVPRLLYLPTASGDQEANVAHFHHAFDHLPCETNQLSLFRLGADGAIPLRDFILSMDIVYVGGGSMRNLLAIWRAHDLDRILAEALPELSRTRLQSLIRDGLVAAPGGEPVVDPAHRVEPGGACSLACLLNGQIAAQGRTVGIVLSGGNVDPALFARVLAGEL